MLKIVRWTLFILGILFILIMAIITPIAWIGLLVYLFGAYQMRQKNRGKMTFSKPGWFIGAGIIFSFIMAMIFVEPVEETATSAEEVKSAEVKKEEQSKEQAEVEANEEQKAQEEAEEEARVKSQEEAAKEEAERQATIAQEELDEHLVNQFALEAVTVGRVVDGDTIELLDGRKVRLIGVNTPESTTRTEQYGKEASNYTKSKLNGAKVWLQKDVSETDRYGRHLRIVWLDIPTDLMNESEIRTKMFNADLVLNGYAEPSTYPPDVKYSEYFVKFAREAREDNTGLWAYGETGTTKGDLDQEGTANGGTTVTPPSSNGTAKAYKNCTELRKDYPNGVASNHPAYASKHDRDNDGYACER
jgi:micrococcal nuclease